MALYRPIVDISGNLIELPDGDYIKPNLLGSNTPTVDTVLTGNNTWVTGASFNYWTKTGNDLSYVLGNVGIGTTLPQALGHFFGDNAAVIIQSNVAAVNTATSSLHIGQKEASPNIGLNANYRLSYNSQNFTISYASSGGITGSFSERLRINSSGNVGIGTDNPTNKLEVVTGATGAYFTRLSGNVGVTAPAIGLLTAIGTTRINSFGDALQFFTGVVGSTTTQKMTILASGEVGIGTGTPTQKLTVVGNIMSTEGGTAALPKLTLSASTTTGIYTPMANGWGVSTNAVSRLVIDAVGNIGIGTTSPAQALHVFTATPYQIQVQRSGVASALIGVSAQTANSTGDLLFEATQASQGFVFRSRDASNAVLNSLGIDRNGNVGIGIFSPSYRLDVSGGARFTNDVVIGGGAVGVNSLLVTKNITGGVDASGIRSSGQIQSDVTNSAFMFRAVVNQANFDLPTLIVYESQIGTISGTGTNFINFRAAANPTGFTNVYGFQGIIASGTNRWNLYMSGTAPNHMAGSLGIGATGLAGHGIRNSKTITGGASGFSYANYSDGQIQSDVTGAAWYFRSFANTQPTAFTLPEIRHFDATQGTIGAGSSVTVQTAFLAGSTLVGASFANYGFRGNIPAGTGRWNAFMDGTAQNHFRGNVGIGAGSTVPTTELDVLGITRTTNLRITNGAAVGKVWQCNNVNGAGEWVTPLTSERYIGEWAANSGVAPSASPTTGDYYVVNTAGTYLGITYSAGDEIYWNGTAWLKRSNFLTLPIATSSVLGGIKIGTGLSIDGSGVVSVASSPILTTARTISATGDGTWSVNFNGSADVSGALTLATVVTADTYRSVTVNAKGLVTAGTNPTTISGYGITDFYSQIVSGFVTGANSTVLNTDSLEIALEKLQGQINGRFTTPTGLTANYLPKWNGTAFVNSSLIDNGTNVGINIAVPASTFHISSASTILSITSTDTSSGLRINVLGQTTGIIFRVQSAGTTLLQQNTNGRLLVGYTEEVNAYKVQVDSGAVGGLGLYVRGNINATGNIIADGYFSGTSSDKSYKSNFKKVTVINVIDNIKVLSYNHELYNNSRLIGSIAQDIQKYFPELITIDGKGKLRVDNYGYAALSLQLGKELKNEVDVLKEKINKLELQIEKLSK